MPTIMEHRISACRIDAQTGNRIPTAVTFIVDQESFKRTRAALVVDRGGSDSYRERCNSGSFNPGQFSYTVGLEELHLPYEK
jgi:hypothetical protein